MPFLCLHFTSRIVLPFCQNSNHEIENKRKRRRKGGGKKERKNEHMFCAPVIGEEPNASREL
jgi:hypothetical protein